MRSYSQFTIVLSIAILIVVLPMVFIQLEIGAAAANNAGWDEVGSGSASGGGISDNTGESGWPSVAIGEGNRPYIAWYDTSSGDKEIYVRRWNGSIWTEVGTRSASQGGISNNSSISTAPSIAAGADGKPCVTWRDFSSGFFEIYLRCWNGSSWIELGTNSATDGGVSNQQGTSSWGPSLAFAPDGTPYVAWDNGGEHSNEIYVARWNGDTWEKLPASGSISNSVGNSWLPSLAIASDGTPYVAWQDESSSDTEIYVRRWNGMDWVEVGTGSASGGGISRNSGRSAGASLAISNDGTPYVAWQDDSGGNPEIYIRGWNGSSWVEVGAGSAAGSGISQNLSVSAKPSLAINEDEGPCIAWQDNSQGQNETYIRCWYDSYWSEVNAGSASGSGISSNNGQSSAPALAVGSDGRAYATWGDNSRGNYEIYVRSRLLPAEPPPTATNTPQPTATSTVTPSPTYTPTNTQVPGTSTPTATPHPQVNFPIILYQAPPTPTRLPIFIGLNARWDGRGFLRLDEYAEPGTHMTMVFTEMVDNDIAQAENRHWYDPNPEGWESDNWFSYYSVSTGDYQSSSQPENPAFKWNSPEILPYRFSFQDGDTVEIDGQWFLVSGPFHGVGAFGQKISFWRLVNQDKFLYVDDGSDWKQYVHPGDITLEYDINTRLCLKRDVLRRLYYQDDVTQYTIQYINYLTSSNAYTAQIIRVPTSSSGRGGDFQSSLILHDIPEELLKLVP